MQNEGYNCPACKKAMQIVTINEIEVEACLNSCGGIWFDAAEIFRFTASGIDDSRDPNLQKLLSYKPSANTENREKLTCMKCGIKMRRHEYRENSGIFVDECYECGSIWLDGGELEAILSNPAVQVSNQERAQMAIDLKKKIEEDKIRIAEEARNRYKKYRSWNR
ncbi:MAG: hypothetical protein CVV41_19545 [Candidatus Riflebacteria bacterium HGW-Riflebacteria-1]|jgi:Zn-finger nucleic acid-binding protein|nr:MAG: hypothetical protein CVV41_19545 [Candidatus Riflebacteria bacterium HGW-Riflebacteria-1]